MTNKPTHTPCRNAGMLICQGAAGVSPPHLSVQSSEKMCSGCSWGISPSPACAWWRGYVCSRMYGYVCMYIYIYIYMYVCVYVHIWTYMSVYAKKTKKNHKCRCSCGISPSPKCVHVCMYYVYDMNEYIRQAKTSSSHVSSAPADHTPMSHPTTSQTQQVSCVVI